MNRIDRLTGTILLLQAHRGISAEAIASHWEISVRTVYRDLAALGEAGVPIVFDPPSNGYRLMQGFHVPPVMFTPEEAAALFLSGSIAEQVGDASLKTSLSGALLKIRSVLPESQKEKIEGLENTLGVWLYSGPHNASSECLIPIQNAVLDRKCIRLTYDTGGTGNVNRRTVEPMGILFYNGHWHLIAHCRLRKDFRDFRMDRVKNWTILDESFQARVGFSIGNFVKSQIQGQRSHTVSLNVDNSCLSRLRRELFWAPCSETPCGENRVRFEFPVDNLDWLPQWLLSFGTCIRVERPESLAKTVVDKAQAICGIYST